jgi:phenol hydroxylase P1 protein
MTVDLQAREIQPLRNTFSHVARYVGDDKPATRYQEATFGAQATSNFHYRPTWDPEYELFDASRSKVVLADWYVLKDPRQFYYGTWTMARARQQDAMESSYQFVESRDLINKMPDDLRDKVCQVIIPLRHVAWGGNMNNCMIAAYGYGTAFTAPASLHAMDELGVAQYITRLGLALDEPSVLDAGKEAWLKAPQWQALRHLVEDSFVVKDPFELFVAQNLAIDGLLYPLIFGHFIDDHVALNGGTAVSMLSAFMVEWHEESNRWVDAVVKTAAAESEANKTRINEWTHAWSKRMHDALVPIAQMALGDKGASTLEDVLTQFQARCKKLGLSA